MVGPGELRPVPHRLVSFARGELAWDLDRFPTGSFPDGQPVSLPLTQGRPHRLPTAQLADAARSLRKGKEQAVAHAALTKAPSAVEHTMIGRSTAAASAASEPRAIRA